MVDPAARDKTRAVAVSGTATSGASEAGRRPPDRQADGGAATGTAVAAAPGTAPASGGSAPGETGSAGDPPAGRAVTRPAELRLAAAPGQGGKAAGGPKRASLYNRGSALAWKQLRGQYTDFLPEHEAISGQRHSPVATLLVGIIAAFFLIFLLWAGFTEVEQSVQASGQVRPDGRVKVVNHAEGGRVAAIMVREGERVTEGQPLLRLNPELLKSEFDRVTGNWQEVAARTARLEAEALGEREIPFPREIVESRPDLVALQRSQYRSRLDARENRQSQAENSILQREAEISSTEQLLSSQREGLVILERQGTSLKELAGKGYFPWLRYQSVERDISDRKGEIARLQQSLAAGRAALDEARAQRELVDQDFTNSVYDELTAARSERESLAEQRAQLAARLRDLTLTAPSDGIVQDLNVINIGQSISPLEPLMTIVPVSGKLIIEAKVPNNDIGQIHVGQTARVKVRTYDFLKYGVLMGNIVRIDADATTDEKTGQVFYETEIRTDRDHLGLTAGEQPVTPGMLVDVEMQTGKKSILAYITDRILSTTDTAFTEN